MVGLKNIDKKRHTYLYFLFFSVKDSIKVTLCTEKEWKILNALTFVCNGGSKKQR